MHITTAVRAYKRGSLYFLCSLFIFTATIECMFSIELITAAISAVRRRLQFRSHPTRQQLDELI